MAVLTEVKPERVFHFFEELCKIPHGTFDTKRISDYCVAFAKERGLEVEQDEANDVIIKKPGTPGYENSEPVILQGHMDMVCEKTPDSDHDFKTDGLDLYVEDGYVKARGTTLGGDDGIAIAMAMAILDSDDIPHPPIEAVFTVDEETGMGGAEAVDLSGLKGKKLLNIDSEEEGVLTSGCAGGIVFETLIPVAREEKEGTKVRIKVHGLLGGHSGNEIHRQRGNAHKMLGRLLYRIQKEAAFDLISINGGSKDNVIASESEAVLLAAEKDVDKILAMAEEMKEIWLGEFMGEEPTLDVTAAAEGAAKEAALTKEAGERVIAYLMLCPNGLIEYSRKLKGLVETSLNLGILKADEEVLRAEYSVRSSVESEKDNLIAKLSALVELTGGDYVVTGDYPGWKYRVHSPLREKMVKLYAEMYGNEPRVEAIHAGLECGLLGSKITDLDCVSMGPDMKDIHTTEETLSISSTKRVWEYLVRVLETKD